ncbi:hypothetical protein SRABI02_03552 [Plantibacter cousiniae]|nr:hypothetical protein SRABI02_03552 [Plantibacter cousiniae]
MIHPDRCRACGAPYDEYDPRQLTLRRHLSCPSGLTASANVNRATRVAKALTTIADALRRRRGSIPRVHS